MNSEIGNGWVYGYMAIKIALGVSIFSQNNRGCIGAAKYFIDDAPTMFSSWYTRMLMSELCGPKTWV